MAFKNGDFLEIEYSLWNATDKSMLDTTSEKEAKEHGLYREGSRYGPVLVVLGERNVVKGLEAALTEMEPGQKKKITLKPVEAFGERDSNLLRPMPLSEFKKRDINPYPAMKLNMDNMLVIVKSINSGRVIIDANHPYAGIEVTYEINGVKPLVSKQEKIGALGRTYSVEPTSVKAEGKTVELSFGEKVNKNADYFMGRANLIAAIFTYFKDTENVKVTEDYARPKETEKKEPEHDHEH
jgi:peptidylprolyl isomerase